MTRYDVLKWVLTLGSTGLAVYSKQAAPEVSNVLDAIMAFFISTQLYNILVLLAVDFALGVSVGIKQGEFSWKKMGDVYKNVAAYVLGYLTVYLATASGTGMLGDGVDVTAFAVLVQTLSTEVADKLKVLYGGD